MKTIYKKAVRLFRQILIAAVAAILLWTIIAMMFEEKFIYFPDKYPTGFYADGVIIPRLTDCWIKTEDGIRIHAWFAPIDSAHATLVMAHGNAGNLSHRYQIIRKLQQTGFNVLMFDYRGYGKSEGSPSEEGIYLDGRAAFDYARNLPEVDSQRIILWGTSLGGAVAVEVATHRPAAGLILESTFTSTKDMAAVHYPFLPVRFLLRTQFNTIDKISKVQVPLLMIHGAQDRIVPIQLGRTIFSAANEPKEFYEITDADHNDTYYIGGGAYLKRICDFARRISPAK